MEYETNGRRTSGRAFNLKYQLVKKKERKKKKTQSRSKKRNKELQRINVVKVPLRR